VQGTLTFACILTVYFIALVAQTRIMPPRGKFIAPRFFGHILNVDCKRSKPASGYGEYGFPHPIFQKGQLCTHLPLNSA
jgi:hypothetical protein